MVKDLNRALFKRAKRYMAGGVSSPARSFAAVGGQPIFIKQAKAENIYSEDGRRFLDYCLSWGALILGHAHPKVMRELRKTLDKGTSFGACLKLEAELAKTIIKAMPSIEKVRLTNSGTEAVMGAVRLARAFTRKNKIIRFKGAYHGHADYLLESAGVPQDFKKHTLISPYNDIKKVIELFKAHSRDIAAVIVEPVAANMGVVLPKEGFLEELRKVSRKYNSVLIFDEVITGFRLSLGGAQEYFGIAPDITCLGKIMGGGLPAGAFGARREIMKLLAPEGKVYQSGTFSGNPLTVTAGLATLNVLLQERPYLELGEKTKYLCGNINSIAAASGIKIKINFIGSMFSLGFEKRDLFKSCFHLLLSEGIYLSPSPLEANFISTAHTPRDLNATLEAVQKTFRKLSPARNTG